MRGIVLSVVLLLTVSFQLSAYADSAPYTLADVQKMFLEDRYDDVINTSRQLIHERSYRRDEFYYLKGLSELKLNRFNDARASFNAIVCGRTNSTRLFDSYIGIGDSYFLENNYDAAIKTYEDTLGAFPENDNRAVLYYRLSECYARCGDAAKAQYYLDSAKLVAPLSFEAKAQPVVRRPRVQAVPDKAVLVVSDAKPARDAKTTEAHISVQVGSFKNKENAQRFADKLSYQGFDSHLEPARVSGGSVYRVKVGKFTSRNDAVDTVNRLKARGYSIKICDNDICE